MSVNENEIQRLEHDEVFHVKKARIYGTDGTNLVTLKLNSDGSLPTSAPVGGATYAAQTDGTQKTQIVDPAGNHLEVVKQNDTYNAATHGIPIFGAADTGAGPDKYVQIRVHDDGSLLSHPIDSGDAIINPATKEGQGLSKTTVALTSSGTIIDPSPNKKIRIYNMKFSLSADMTSVAFKWNSSTAFEKYLAPKSGGLYGTNLHPNYLEGATDAILNCDIVGTGTVQINLEYLEI